MTKLEKMIEELCPNGVEYVKLGTFATISRGGSFQKKDFCENGVPCIHYGQIYTKYGLFADKTITFISEETAKKQKFAEPNDIVMAVTSENVEDVCKCLAWIGNEKIAVSGHSAIIHHNQNAKYLCYYFHTSAFFQQKRKLAHGTKVIEVKPDSLKDVLIPLPPLEVQAEIVRILDDYSTSVAALQQELEKELTTRKKQYEYYRDELLTFGDEVEWKTIENSSNCSRGKRVVKTDLNQNGSFAVYQNCLTPMGYYNQSNRKANITYVITAGAAGEIGFCNDEFWAADDCLTIESNGNIIDKYIYYFLMSKQDYIKTRVRKASIPRLDRKVIENIKIPVPPLSEQTRIVQILDRFDKLCNDISEGLPAEIEARQKQYEYYRDKLLTFKEAK